MRALDILLEKEAVLFSRARNMRCLKKMSKFSLFFFFFVFTPFCLEAHSAGHFKFGYEKTSEPSFPFLFFGSIRTCVAVIPPLLMNGRSHSSSAVFCWTPASPVSFILLRVLRIHNFSFKCYFWKSLVARDISSSVWGLISHPRFCSLNGKDWDKVHYAKSVKSEAGEQHRGPLSHRRVDTIEAND